MKIILEKAVKQFKQNLPFALYKKPNNNIVTGFFQKNNTLFLVNDFSEKGFVFASFDGSKTIIIPENYSEIKTANCNDNKTNKLKEDVVFLNKTDQNSFEKLVSKGIQAIKNNEFKKIVLSRKESVDLLDFDLMDAFENLVYSYSSAFVYCFYHPRVGIWIGASPEQLLKATNRSFQTIALAGTQKDSSFGKVYWKKKEQEEQQFVTDYIVETLKTVASEIFVSKPYSLKAGNIWHIKTEISGVLNSGFGLYEVIYLLHPTPAVCGLPKEKSKLFILENEKYDRTFYTGFLGELNIENKTDLFVNLRCMEIEFDSNLTMTKAHLFMGCGITKDSIPEKEWEESINKSATMKKIL